MKGPHGQDNSLRRSKHFIQTCILCPREKIKEIDKKRVLLVNPVQNKLCWKIIIFENFTHYDP